MEFNHNQYLEYRILDSLIDNNIRFALYRLPGENDINLILQTSPNENQFDNLPELNNKQGFIIAPFKISEKSPVILIEPDIAISSEKVIFSYLNNFDKTYKEEGKFEPIIKSVSDTFTTYKKAYEKYQSALKDYSFQKLVLSRTYDHIRTKDFSAGIAFKQACIKYPDNFVYLCNTYQTGAWFGCSPELLISGQLDDWKTVALAGTKDSDSDAWDEKNRIEQQIVVDYMQQQLRKGNFPYTQSKTTTIQSGNLRHIKTDFSFKTNGSDSIGNILQLLHPSPAVCGFPKDEAFHFITNNEGYDRRYYSGFLGNLNLNAKTDLFVNLRCMQINKDNLRLYAGGGILSSSELESEWKETENKLQTILSIVGKM